jgi:tetratricopeptide (TPR) repeat protein
MEKTNHVQLTQPPTVSVVIPAYNQARYLPEAVASVLAQTWRDFELIIVDDGATDATPEVIDRFLADASIDRPLRSIRQVNQGLAGARNTGIRLARGAWIGLLDSDDLWEPRFLEALLAAASADPQAAVVYCPVRYIDPQGELLPQVSAGLPLPPPELADLLLRVNPLGCSTVLIRHQTLVEAGLFDPAFRRLQDWELWQRLVARGDRFVGVAEPLGSYRIHTSSLTHDTAGGRAAVNALVTKLYGPEAGNPATWEARKRRAYGGAYRYNTLNALSEGDWPAAAAYLARALEIDPSLVDDASLFYELALGPQPLGRRGPEYVASLAANAVQVEELLARLAADAPALARQLSRIRAAAFTALGWLAYHRREFALSRRWWRQARVGQPTRAARLRLETLIAKTYLKPLLGNRRVTSLEDAS